MKKRALAAAILAAVAGHSHAFKIDAGSDWSVRWDNSFKYNLMMRQSGQDKDVYESGGGTQPITGTPDLSFDKGEIVSNRVDWLSELDVVWDDTFGFRVSAAAWYDHAYSNTMNQPTSGPYDVTLGWSNPSAAVGELSDTAEKYHYKGGELLDAFVFWNWEAGDVTGNLRAGRHSIYWGQSLLLTGAVNSAGGAMNAINLSKAITVPGTEAKELFMPTNKISTVMQLTDNLTVSAYYSLEWANYRLPEGTTYFSMADTLTEDTEAYHLRPGLALETLNDEHPDEGEWGVNFSYYFEDLGLEASLYYLNFHSKTQDGLVGVADSRALGLSPNPILALAALDGVNTTPTAAAPATAYIGNAKWLYKEDNDLFGLSLSKRIGDISFGLDLSYRKDVPLRQEYTLALAGRTPAGGSLGFAYPNTDITVSAMSEALSGGALAGMTGVSWSTVLGSPAFGLGPSFDFAAADEGNYTAPTGDTLHLVINAMGTFGSNGFWDGGSYIVEASFSMLEDINSEYSEFLAQGIGSELTVNKGRVASHVAAVFRPTWYQVFPGTDMTVPMTLSYGIDGHSPITSGGDEEIGSFSIGAEFDIKQKWSLRLMYNAFFGPKPNGVSGNLKDRDNIALTIKRTF